MPIIIAEIMKTRWTEAIMKAWELNNFNVHLSLHINLQLICKASLIFKSNLEFYLALSITLKQRELYDSKHVAEECRCLKIWDLLSFLIFQYS